LPPNRDVMRRMKVDLPHPESAARPMMTGPSLAARVTTRARVARRAFVGVLATTGAARVAGANPRCADMLMCVFVREVTRRACACVRKRSFRTCTCD